MAHDTVAGVERRIAAARESTNGVGAAAERVNAWLQRRTLITVVGTFVALVNVGAVEPLVAVSTCLWHCPEARQAGAGKVALKVDALRMFMAVVRIGGWQRAC